MPRKYERKTDKNNWTEAQLKGAIRSITCGRKLKIRDASRRYGIPESTLRKRMKLNSLEHVPLGCKPTFTIEEEAQLADHIINLAKLYYGITPLELRRLAYEFAEANKINHFFNTTLKLAGKDWLYLFLKRHPCISLRQSEGTSLNRITAFNKDFIIQFFNNLNEVFQTFKFKPNQIYNMDETGITTVQKKCPKIYAQKGAKKVGAVTSGERGRTITAVFCVNAAGYYIPPMLIYPRAHMTSQLQRNGPIGAIYDCSKNGWTNEHLYMKWLLHFKNHVKPTHDNPVLLILDNHTSHISLTAFEFCKANFITVVTLPPHTSHKTQPLDLTFLGPLKIALYREYELFLSTNVYEKITEYNFAELLNKAFLKVATMEKGISGFSSAGIWPLNPDKFNEDNFTPDNAGQELVLEALSEIFEPNENVDFNEGDNSADRETIAFSAPNDSISDPLDSIPSASTSKFTIADFAPVPSRNAKIRYSHTKMQSEILTASPQKRKLEQAKEKKIDVVRKKIERLKKKADSGTKKNLKSKIESKKRMKIKVLKSEKSTSSDINTDNLFPPNEQCTICGKAGRDKKL
ncbi:tigger transposable element-derived protein 6-like [Mycetomoellerius zeteki]|uniref:tigger transposable element-derived protein 6-like n=1 Tax=Mycetomoellerius zeteki TaxID=64791 RepID=UPI00084E58F4|nr:PREDICTED: tigger transposable element-derived protein 6-like [Trachymyrmex zeteki]XP_018318038.1 PREDICTED: tigger transposable element-derived protein 6-like [Trachymyrmex zeteki]